MRRGARASGRLLLVAWLVAALVSAAAAVRLHAAGSLRAALTEVAAGFTQASGIPVLTTFDASGLLRERLERGEPGGVFASANMEHPRALADRGLAGPVVLFARNQLCALARAELGVMGATLLDRLLDPGIWLGTSTPGADPSGDYAWAVFRRAEALRPGSRATLEAKARMLMGGPTSPPPPTDRSPYGPLLTGGQADVFLTYCTNATQAMQETQGLRMMALPAPLAVGADCGLTVLGTAPRGASRLALYVLSPAGQTILARHGFAAPTLPSPGS